MVTIMVPTPQSEPTMYSSFPRHLDNLPEDVQRFLAFCQRQIESEVLSPLLAADQLPDVFMKVFPRYQHWIAAAAEAMIATIGFAGASALSGEALAQMRKLIRELGNDKLQPQEQKMIQEGIDIISLIQERILKLSEESPDKLAEMTNEADKAVMSVLAFNLCAAALVLYLQQAISMIDGRANANAASLAQWGFQYADIAYLDWGSAEVTLGLYSSMSELTT